MNSNNNKQNRSISSARKQLKQSMDKFKLPKEFNPEEFRQVANGFFQAKGHISCRIKGNYFSPLFLLNQNLSGESLYFFLTLWHVLGRTATLSLTINKQKPKNIVIRLSSESWETILNNYAKYFDNIYGEKWVAFLKLTEIRQLTSIPTNLKKSTCPHPFKELKPDPNPTDLNLAIHLVYDLCKDGLNPK